MLASFGCGPDHRICWEKIHYNFVAKKYNFTLTWLKRLIRELPCAPHRAYPPVFESHSTCVFTFFSFFINAYHTKLLFGIQNLKAAFFSEKYSFPLSWLKRLIRTLSRHACVPTHVRITFGMRIHIFFLLYQLIHTKFLHHGIQNFKLRLRLHTHPCSNPIRHACSHFFPSLSIISQLIP